MLENRRRLSALYWTVAGLPIIASFVQASVALAGTSANEIPIIGALQSALRSIAVFNEAAFIFRSSMTVVFLLFALVSVAWLVQGASIFILRHRVSALGASGFITLFLILFGAVYLPLLSADVPILQAVGFLSIPLIAVTASWAASLVFDWDVTLDDETSEWLAEARSEAQSAKQEFNQRINAAANNDVRTSLRQYIPNAIDRFESKSSQFQNKCQSILDRAGNLTQASLSSQQRNEKAAQLLSDADELSPNERAEALQNELEQALTDWIRDEFADLHYVSRYGQEYEIRNLPKYNEISLSSIDGPDVQIGGSQHELNTRLVGALENQSLAAVVNAVEEVESHLDNLESVLEENEKEVVTALNGADEAVDIAQTHIERLHGEAQERLTEYLLEGRIPDTLSSVPNQPSIAENQQEAKQALHDGQFTAAQRNSERAQEEARSLQEIAEFFGEGVAATIDYGSGSIAIPDTVGSDLTSNLQLPFQQTCDIGYTVRGTTLEISGGGEDAIESQATETQVASSGRTGANPDDVLYVIRELRSVAAASSADNSVELQTETLQEKFTNDVVLTELKSFAERQSNVKSVTIPDDPPPGFISLEVSDDVSPERVLTELQDNYVNSQ